MSAFIRKEKKQNWPCCLIESPQPPMESQVFPNNCGFNPITAAPLTERNPTHTAVNTQMKFRELPPCWQKGLEKHPQCLLKEDGPLVSVRLEFVFRTRKPHTIRFSLKQALLVSLKQALFLSALRQSSLVWYRQRPEKSCLRDMRCVFIMGCNKKQRWSLEGNGMHLTRCYGVP